MQLWACCERQWKLEQQQCGAAAGAQTGSRHESSGHGHPAAGAQHGEAAAAARPVEAPSSRRCLRRLARRKPCLPTAGNGLPPPEAPAAAPVTPLESYGPHARPRSAPAGACAAEVRAALAGRGGGAAGGQARTGGRRQAAAAARGHLAEACLCAQEQLAHTTACPPAHTPAAWPPVASWLGAPVRCWQALGRRPTAPLRAASAQPTTPRSCAAGRRFQTSASRTAAWGQPPGARPPARRVDVLRRLRSGSAAVARRWPVPTYAPPTWAFSAPAQPVLLSPLLFTSSLPDTPRPAAVIPFRRPPPARPCPLSRIACAGLPLGLQHCARLSTGPQPQTRAARGRRSRMPAGSGCRRRRCCRRRRHCRRRCRAASTAAAPPPHAARARRRATAGSGPTAHRRLQAPPRAAAAAALRPPGLPPGGRRPLGQAQTARCARCRRNRLWPLGRAAAPAGRRPRQPAAPTP